MRLPTPSSSTAKLARSHAATMTQRQRSRSVSRNRKLRLKFIDTDQFQRLRDLKQLGELVYWPVISLRKPTMYSREDMITLKISGYKESFWCSRLGVTYMSHLSISERRK